jgi:YidC/Oxa1 family membrane protein insertase
MEKKRTILAVLLTVVLVSGWLYMQKYMRERWPDAYATPEQPQQPVAPADPATSQPTTGPATAPSATVPSTGPTTVPAVAAGTPTGTAPSIQPAPGGLRARRTNATSVVLGPQTDQPDDPTYAMRVTLNSNGAGVDGVTLNNFRRGEDFKKKLADREVYTFQHPYPGKEYLTRPLATTEVTIDDKPVSLAYDAWVLQSSGPGDRLVATPGQPGGAAVAVKGQQAVFVATVVDGERPVLELTKTYTLFARDTVTKGYELAVDQKVRNLTDRPVRVKLAMNGPGLPPRESARTPDRQLMGGYTAAGGAGPVTFKSHTIDVIKAEAPAFDLTTYEGQPARWVGASSVYFDAFVLFDDPAKVAKATASSDTFDPNVEAENRPTFITFQTAQLDLPAAGVAGDAAVVPMTAHFGPRWRQVLNETHYATAPRQYNSTLIITSGPCAICTFGWLIDALVMMLNGFHWLAGGFAGAGDWGIAIIMLVALVRTLLHPITKRSQVHMMKMGKMGPALAKLKEKHGDDKDAFAKAQMELIKEQGIAPVLGCLPMFLQMPIWIALWQALQSTFELRQAPFLWGATWIHDLSRPDYLFKFDHSYPLLFGFHLDGLNLLPILMGGIFHLQARIQNSLQAKGTAEQETQKKMMLWMSTFLFPLFLYNGPSGLNLYILTSTLVGIIEAKVIRDHIKQREAAEAAAGPVVVDARPTRGARRAAGERRDPEPTKPAGGLGGLIQRAQTWADEMAKKGQDRPGGSGKAK